MYIEGLLKPRHELGEALLVDCIIEKKIKEKGRTKERFRTWQKSQNYINEGTVTFKLKALKFMDEKLLQLPVVTPPPRQT